MKSNLLMEEFGNKSSTNVKILTKKCVIKNTLNYKVEDTSNGKKGLNENQVNHEITQNTKIK